MNRFNVLSIITVFLILTTSFGLAFDNILDDECDSFECFKFQSVNAIMLNFPGGSYEPNEPMDIRVTTSTVSDVNLLDDRDLYEEVVDSGSQHMNNYIEGRNFVYEYTIPLYSGLTNVDNLFDFDVYLPESWYNQDKFLLPYFTEYSFNPFKIYSFLYRDDYETLRYFDGRPEFTNDLFSPSLTYDVKEDPNVVNPLLRYANIGSYEDPIYILPQPWVQHKISFSCDSDEEETIKYYQPYQMTLAGDQESYDFWLDNENNHPYSYYPNSKHIIYYNTYETQKFISDDTGIYYRQNVLDYISDYDPTFLSDIFTCEYDNSKLGTKPKPQANIFYRKNRFYVLLEEFLDNDYVDNEFTSVSANPFQLGLEDEETCFKGESTFSQLAGKPLPINQVTGESMVLHDEYCIRSVVQTLPTLQYDYNESNFANETDSDYENQNLSRLPNTAGDNEETTSYNNYINKQIYYEDLRSSVRNKNKILETLVDIGGVVFALLLISYYVIQIGIFSYVMKKWIPQMINMVVNFLKKIKFGGKR